MKPVTQAEASSIDLTVNLGFGLVLPSPFIAASGSVGFGDDLADLTKFEGLGALITPSITVEPRPGNSMPRTAEASAGLIHSTGLPNSGLAALMKDHLPALKALPCSIFASIAARSPADWFRLASALTDANVFAGLELNLGWLDSAVSGDAVQPPLTEAALADAIRSATGTVRSATSLPILAKLPGAGIDAGFAARVAIDSGANIISTSNAVPAVAIRISSRSFRLPGIVGALSGPCIKPLALYQVWRVRESVQDAIVGSGGIMTAEDALEFMIVGAQAVSIGVANYVHPAVIATMASDMRAFLFQNGFAGIRAFQQSIAR